MLFVTPYSISADIDYTNLGVSVGDEFEFVMSQFDFEGIAEATGEEVPCLSEDDETGECLIEIEAGITFTIKITSLTSEPANTTDPGEEVVPNFAAEITTGDINVEDREDFGSDLLSGGLLIPLDFEALKAATQEQLDEDAASVEDIAEASFSGKIIETETEIGADQSSDADFGSLSASSDVKVRYSKTTGVLLYYFIDSHLSSFEGDFDATFEMHQTSYDLPGGDEGLLEQISGFPLYLTVITLAIPVTIKKRKSNRTQ